MLIVLVVIILGLTGWLFVKRMRVSDSNEIQFWLRGQTPYNEDVIPYIQKKPFYQIKKTSDVLRVDGLFDGLYAPDWDNTVSYSIGEFIFDPVTMLRWKSLEDGNLGNNPQTDPTFIHWTPDPLMNTPVWDGATDYNAGNRTLYAYSAGPYYAYTSRVSGNLNKPPRVSLNFTSVLPGVGVWSRVGSNYSFTYTGAMPYSSKRVLIPFEAGPGTYHVQCLLNSISGISDGLAYAYLLDSNHAILATSAAANIAAADFPDDNLTIADRCSFIALDFNNPSSGANPHQLSFHVLIDSVLLAGTAILNAIAIEWNVLSESNYLYRLQAYSAPGVFLEEFTFLNFRNQGTNQAVSIDLAFHVLLHNKLVRLFIVPTIAGVSDPDNWIAQSDCVNIRDNFTASVQIDYSNKNDFDDMGRSGASVLSTIRVEGLAWIRDTVTTEEDQPQSDGTILSLRSESKKKLKFEVGPAPDYLHDKLVKVFQHAFVRINGVRYIRQDDYQRNRIDRSTVYFALCWLTDRNSLLVNIGGDLSFANRVFSDEWSFEFA